MKEELQKKLLAVFQAESREHMAFIRSFLSRAEEAGTAAPGPALDESFRRAHSLKGAARAVDLPVVQTLAHRAETLFSRAREGQALGKEAVRALQRVLDAVEDWTEALFNNRPLPDTAPALAAIDGILGSEKEPAPPSAAPEPSAPAAADASIPLESGDTVRLGAEDLDRLLRTTDQLLTESLRQDSAGQDLARIGREVAGLEKEWDRTRRSSGAALQNLAQDPRYKRVMRFMDVMTHGVHALARQVRAAALTQKRGAWALRHGARQLQQEVRQARMMPVEGVFQSFRKMVRDLARDEKKEIILKTRGLEARADRAVLQALKDPVMHLLRNAVSHAMEAPEERKKAGKDPQGTVSLSIEVLGNRLTVLVEDDGRGVDFQRVREVAVKRKLLAEGAPASDEELGRLIFHPGFSTARGITDLSGRGMGLSVVAEAAARLQGDVQVSKRKGPGTAFLISVPLSVSTHRLILVSSKGQAFALPALGIEKMWRVKTTDIGTHEGRPSVVADGVPMPLHSLAGLLGAGEPAVKVMDSHVPVVLLRAGRERAAVAVDQLLAERDMVVKELSGPAARLPGLLGAVLLEDGSPALVLKPAKLLESSRQARGVTLEKAGAAEEEKARRILVVDDSITTRTLEKAILEAHGYHVQVAVDGVEALAKLRSDAFDLVISDIEMPRMDGFALLEALKRDERLSKVPVIMVTSVEDRREQEKGLSLGAEAYLVKRKFDQRNLLETIQQIL